MSFSIDDLINDCLLLIFYQLSLGDRIKIRLTCTRWATLMPFDDIDSLDVDSLPFAREQFFPGQYSYKIRRSNILRAFDFILPRIGANLKTIIFGRPTDIHEDIQLLLNNYHFDLIIQHCPKLEKMEISINADLNYMDFAKLAIQLSQMTSLHTMSLCDERLTDLQKVNFATAFGDRIWSYLTDLTVNFNCRKVMVAPKLKNLTLANLNNFALWKWCKAHPNVPSLNLTRFMFTDNYITNFTPIARLKHLTTLNMAHNELNDFDLRLICSNCSKLVSVNLNLTRVTRFDCLQLLECLTDMRIFVRETFNESDIVAIVKRGILKSVNVRDRGFHSTSPRYKRRSVFDLISLATFNPNLEVLEIGVLIPSEEVILTVLEVCKQLRSFLLYSHITFSSNVFAAIGDCKNLSKLKLTSAVSAEHYRRLLDARQQNGLRHRLQVVVAEGQQTDEKTFLKEELKKVNVFV